MRYPQADPLAYRKREPNLLRNTGMYTCLDSDATGIEKVGQYSHSQLVINLVGVEKLTFCPK
jgi:hypothetical protein